MKRLSYFNLTLSFISLMFFWIIMSGMLAAPQLIQGVISVGVVIAVNYKLKQHSFFDDEMDDLHALRFHYTPIFVLWLIKEIILAGLHVARVILSKDMPVETYILKFNVDLPSAHARMILGNSITLTPGTLTIDISDSEFTVHALTSKSFEGIVDGTMPGKVLKLFESEERPVIYNIRTINRTDQMEVGK